MDIRGAGVFRSSQPIVQKMAKRQNGVYFTRKRAVLEDFSWEDRKFFRNASNLARFMLSRKPLHLVVFIFFTTI
jgi:hypothetical protein